MWGKGHQKEGSKHVVQISWTKCTPFSQGRRLSSPHVLESTFLYILLIINIDCLIFSHRTSEIEWRQEKAKGPHKDIEREKKQQTFQTRCENLEKQVLLWIPCRAKKKWTPYKCSRPFIAAPLYNMLWILGSLVSLTCWGSYKAAKTFLLPTTLLDWSRVKPPGRKEDMIYLPMERNLIKLILSL